MTPLDKCPVCGGKIVEKEVEKILRGGNLAEIVKVQAEVCLRCGERLYAPDVVKRFEKIRSKLKKEAKTNAPNTASARLLNKLAYEIWFLDFLENRYDMVRGKDARPVIGIKNSERGSNVRVGNISISLKDHFAIDGATTLLNATMPFTFIASFKTLDMIFEWILAENSIKVPRQFTEKKKLLKNKSSLQLPTLFKNQPYLYDYSKALFCQLLPYRNEVVHRNNFSVSENTLTLSDSETGNCLTLSSEQVECLVRLVRVLVRALVGEIVVGDYKAKLLCYYLDILAPVHELAAFNQQMPHFVHVELTVPKQGPSFPADMKKVHDTVPEEVKKEIEKSASFPADMKDVREKVKRSSPTQEVVFDLTVQAVEGENLIAKWYFAPEEVPDLDVMTFYEESHKAHRVALDESETIKA